MAHHILFTGGGTLGPVTPLLSVAAQWRRRDPEVRCSWIGTPKGPERLLVEGAKIPFYELTAPRMNRYRKWTYPFIPLHMLWSMYKAAKMLKAIRPDMVFSAGAYVSVPVALVAWLMRIPVWVHELDVRPGVANRVMAPFAKRMSTTWPQSAEAYPAKKTTVVGTMVRSTLALGDRVSARDRYGLRPEYPTLLVLGGGTGAASLNEAMLIIADEVLRIANVIHLTGRGKMLPALQTLQEQGKSYIALEFLHEGLADAYAVADVVVARAGMGTISELAALGKASIIIPLPGSQQEENARALEAQEAADVLSHMTPQVLLQAITKMLQSQEYRSERAERLRRIFPVNADERIVHEALEILAQKKVQQEEIL
jgi:UDP-N-acetylglucosamine--N-acetylmuramyl-(pentapeptide) pyrophosphoryl-undecaprenol N-acetylglucosamine transferase